MDFEHSDQFTQRVEQIIRNFLHIPKEGNSNWKELCQKLEQLQTQLVEAQLSILQYLKQSLEGIREELQCDLEGIEIQSLQKNITIKQSHEINNEDVKIFEQLNKIGQNVCEIEKGLENKIDLLNIKVEKIKINRDELHEQFKSFDARMESQWQGLANVSDQFWEFKKQFEQFMMGISRKKNSLFLAS
ncbi:unnamed protein product [Paramecium sonneborni]|uniref:Uncharacterized protein n=1 Tax=Paramecium sonneborni TaxID=65129 RepID=A0A8S1RDN5_9CILI|nr:unnamed protein product [Paramecium sonneborni]